MLGDNLSDDTENLLIVACNGFCESHPNAEFGPGHVVVSDYNWHCVDSAIEETKRAIRSQIDGNITVYEFCTLVDFAHTLEFLYTINAIMTGEIEKDDNRHN